MADTPPVPLLTQIKNAAVSGQKRAAQRGHQRREASKKKYDPVEQGSPELSKAINTQIANNPNIHKSLRNREKVKFHVRGGQLIAENGSGEILHQGKPGEFDGHRNMTINATPQKRRLGELLFDRESLQEKQQREGRDTPNVSPTRGSKRKLEAEQEVIATRNKVAQSYGNARANKNTVTGISKFIGQAINSGTKQIITWGRTPAGGQSGQTRER